MSDEKRALARHSEPPSEADYEAILAAVMETGRGRWFLHEFAQRNRHVETRGVLSAIQRIEGLLRTQGGALPDGPAEVSADQIATAILRAQAMLGANDDDTINIFDTIGQSLEALQVRMRAVQTRLQDAATALREDGEQTRICSDIERQARDLETGCAQLEDTSGDIRILIALLKDIEDQVVPHYVPPTETRRAPDTRPGPQAAKPVTAEPLAVDRRSSSPEAMTFDGARSETHPAAVDASQPVTAAGVQVQEAAAEASAEAASSGPDLTTLLCGNAGPADFLLEPLPDNAADDDTLVPDAPAIAGAAAPELDIRPQHPDPALRLDSFDPLAPLRALSDEEKIALFS